MSCTRSVASRAASAVLSAVFLEVRTGHVHALKHPLWLRVESLTLVLSAVWRAGAAVAAHVRDCVAVHLCSLPG